MGARNLRKVQLAKEVTYGTPVTVATIIPTGLSGDWHDMSEFTFPGEDEQNGLMLPEGRTVQTSVMAELALDGDATFQNLIYPLQGYKAVTSGAVSGVTGFLYDFPSPTTAKATPTFFTGQAGDDTQAYQIKDLVATDIEISAKLGEDTQVSATLQGHTLTPTTFTAAVPYLAATPIPAYLWKIDDTGSALGTTQKTGILKDWSAKIKTGMHHKNFMDGALAPSNWGQGRPEVTLDFTLEQTTGALAEFAKFQAGTRRLIRLEATGAVIGAGPATQKATLDFVGTYLSFDKPSDADGNTIISGSLKCFYNGTDTAFFRAQIINALATLT